MPPKKYKLPVPPLYGSENTLRKIAVRLLKLTVIPGIVTAYIFYRYLDREDVRRQAAASAPWLLKLYYKAKDFDYGGTTLKGTQLMYDDFRKWGILADDEK